MTIQSVITEQMPRMKTSHRTSHFPDSNDTGHSVTSVVFVNALSNCRISTLGHCTGRSQNDDDPELGSSRVMNVPIKKMAN